MRSCRTRALLVVTLASTSLSVACGGDAENEGTTGSGGGTSSTGGTCTESTGLLHGNVHQFAPAGDPNSKPAANALIELLQSADETPLNAMADDQGAYSVELPPGTWMVGGTSADGYCTPMMTSTATIEACGDVELDIVLDNCVL